MNSSGSPKVGDKVWRLIVTRWDEYVHETQISKVNDDGSVDLEWVTSHHSLFPGMHLSHEGVRFLEGSKPTKPGIWAAHGSWSGRT